MSATLKKKYQEYEGKGQTGLANLGNTCLYVDFT